MFAVLSFGIPRDFPVQAFDSHPHSTPGRELGADVQMEKQSNYTGRPFRLQCLPGWAGMRTG